jgi:DNA mismatch repair ATPase MutS
MLVLNGMVLYDVRQRLKLLFAGLDEACHNLSALSAVLRCIEDEQFSAPRLGAIRQKLFSNGLRASECISRLGTLCDLEESRHNQVVHWLELVILYSLHVALALQRWREQYAALVVQWLEAVAEFEALISIATYAFEHPADPFPEIFDTQTPPRLRAIKLRHPLMPARDCIPNDMALGDEPQVLLVSGSNMSGKSTLLRSVGVNAVLALMGAPVRAESFRISPLTIGASMRISDSLQKGVSHFYAEITRIRRVVELSRPGPLLFLFDEVLQGTNSHDRRIGAEGVLRTLLKNGAAGLVTTHDLALTALEEMFPRKIANVHFQEKLEAGKLSFDYKLREGVVTTSNGLELMKSIGLEV